MKWTLSRPQNDRDMHDRGFVEAYCEHGVGHYRGIHGCDGCCKNWPDEIRDASTKEE